MNESSGKLLTLVGVRGIAALMVIFDHLHLAFFVEVDNQLKAFLDARTPYLFSKALQYFVTGLHDGNFAVWVFWVMSAFVLSAKYFKLAKAKADEESAVYLFKSAVKRYPRLFIPIALSVLFAYALLSLNLMTNNDLGTRLGEHTSQGWLFTFYDFEPSLSTAIKSAAWDSFFNFDRDMTYNTVLWTMEPEFFGSLFLFAFLSLLGNKQIRYFAYPLIGIVLYFRETHWLNAFVLGIALCDLYVNSSMFTVSRKFVGNISIQVVSGVGIMILIGAPNYLGIIHLIIAVALVSFCLSFGGFQKFFSSRLPVYLGKLSFSLYLIHVPILCSVTGFVYTFSDKFIAYPASAIFTSIVTIAVCILSADIFYKYADLQGIKLGEKLADMSETTLGR